MNDKFWDMIKHAPSARGFRNYEMKKTAVRRGALSLNRRSEHGVVLLMVLILSAVALAIMTALIYMTTMGTQTSGMQKRYRTALEAGIAGADVLTQIITARGDTSSFASLNPNMTVPAACTGNSIDTSPYQDIKTKIMTSTTGTAGPNWSSSCNQTLKIDGKDPATYDLSFSVGASPGPVYKVYTKIVDTVEGNTGGSSNAGGNTLVTQAVVSNGSGEVKMQIIPYLYTIEIDAENADANSTERARLQVLYQN